MLMKKFISIVTGMTVVCTFFIGCGNTSKTAENGELNICILCIIKISIESI